MPILSDITQILSGPFKNNDVITYLNRVEALIRESGFDIVERNNEKPWGAYIRIDGKQADKFVNEFFPGLSLDAARLGSSGAELSPKLLIVSANQRLSLQRHYRRAERWKFLTPGYYHKSSADSNPGALIEASAGEEVQFACGDIHRLCGAQSGYVVVAEIWQHTDPEHQSDEDDIERLEDDYSR